MKRNISLCECNKGKIHFYTLLSFQNLFWQNPPKVLEPAEPSRADILVQLKVLLFLISSESYQEINKDSWLFLFFCLQALVNSCYLWGEANEKWTNGYFSLGGRRGSVASWCHKSIYCGKSGFFHISINVLTHWWHLIYYFVFYYLLCFFSPMFPLKACEGKRYLSLLVVKENY